MSDPDRREYFHWNPGDVQILPEEAKRAVALRQKLGLPSSGITVAALIAWLKKYEGT